MLKTKPIIRVVTATEAKNNFGAIIKSAYASDEHLIVEKSGIPVVAIIPMADYQQLVSNATATPDVTERLAAEQKRAEAGRRLKEVMDRVHAQMPDVPPEEEEEVERMIQREVDAVRRIRARQMLRESRAPYKKKRTKSGKRNDQSRPRHQHSRQRLGHQSWQTRTSCCLCAKVNSSQPFRKKSSKKRAEFFIGNISKNGFTFST